MSRPNDLITFFCTIGFVVLHLSFVGVWTFAIWRTRLWFFYIALVVAVCASAISVINVILYYDPVYVPRLLGRQFYAMFFHSFVWAQLSVTLLGLINSLFMVRWIIPRCDNGRSNQALEPTPNRRESSLQ